VFSAGSAVNTLLSFNPLLKILFNKLWYFNNDNTYLILYRVALYLYGKGGDRKFSFNQEGVL
jgi:hypothetical protein